jgi:uncharacterized membrane protein
MMNEMIEANNHNPILASIIFIGFLVFCLVSTYFLTKEINKDEEDYPTN